MHFRKHVPSILFIFFLYLISIIQPRILNENILITFPNKVHYDEALRICKSEGMNLVRIEDDASNQIVYDFAENNGLGTYWIEGSDKKLEGRWIYSDGWNITFSKWYNKDTNNVRNEDCIQGYYFKDNFWNDVNCNSNNSVICYGEPIVRFSENQLVIMVEKKRRHYDYYPSRRGIFWNFDKYRRRHPGFIDFDFPNLPEYDWREDLLVNMHAKKSYQDAIELCRTRGYHLVKIQSDDINKIVFDFAVKNVLGHYWIDGSDIDDEGQWIYNDGGILVYSKWHTDEPNNFKGNEHCIHGLYEASEYWNDVNCDNRNSVICYADKKIDNDIAAFPNQVNYDEALQLCKSEGMKLIQIQNETINENIYYFVIYNELGKYWIDGNDRKLEGKWVYSDGRNIIYSKWYEKQPDNAKNEDCIQGLFYPNGFWNDIDCDSKNTAICVGNRLLSFTKNNLIILPGQVNYRQATDICKDNGFNLVKIQNEHVNQIVYNFAVENKLGKYWIEGSDMVKEGKWIYNDGKGMVYSNWRSNEPNNVVNEDCIIGSSDRNGFWKAISCSTNNTVICYGGTIKV